MAATFRRADSGYQLAQDALDGGFSRLGQRHDWREAGTGDGFVSLDVATGGFQPNRVIDDRGLAVARETTLQQPTAEGFLVQFALLGAGGVAFQIAVGVPVAAGIGGVDFIN